MTERTRIGQGWAALALALALVVAPLSGAVAQDRGGDPAQDLVGAVDPAARTVTLGPDTYAVVDRSRLLDAAGRRMPLSELEVDTMVEFTTRANKRGGPANIVRLQVIEGDFE